jgi:membrane protein DedA with SNARE-associated domain
LVENIISDLFRFFGSFGYLGILLISFVGSIIVFIPLPYFPILITAAFNKQLEPNLISLSSAIGTVIAKIIIFYVSYYGNNILNVKTKKRILPLQRLLSRYGWLGAFIAALTPIPDDLVYIPLGLAKYSPWKFATAIFAGKFLLNEGIVWGTIVLGRPFIENVISDNNATTPSSIIIGIVASGAILGIILYLTVKADWSKIIGKWFPWTTFQERTDSSGYNRDDNNN